MKAGSPSQGLEVLESVAEGLPMESIVALARKAGVEKPFENGYVLRPAEYDVRAYAMEMIGRTGLQEALDYLAGITAKKVVADTDEMIYAASQVALQKALLRRQTDSAKQILFLEQQMTTARVSQVSLWALQELCDRGSLGSLPSIENILMGLDPGQRGKDDVAWCRKRMELASTDPDRVKALASVLNAEAHADSERILQWALVQLLDMHSAEAYAVIDRYEAGVDRRFAHDPDRNYSADWLMHQRLLRISRRSAHTIEAP